MEAHKRIDAKDSSFDGRPTPMAGLPVGNEVT